MRKARLSPEIIRHLIQYFIAGVPARTAAALCAINKDTAAQWYHRFRIIIRDHLRQIRMIFDGEVEADESYFGARRPGKRGRGAADKVAVFGLYKRNKYVYAVIVKNTKGSTLIPIINDAVQPHSIIYTDCNPSYNIIDTSRFQHRRVNHSKEFVTNGNHINGIENFWRQAKRALARYNGIPKHRFDLYLKECEWRFNYRPVERLQETLYYWIMEAGIRLN